MPRIGRCRYIGRIISDPERDADRREESLPVAGRVQLRPDGCSEPFLALFGGVDPLA